MDHVAIPQMAFDRHMAEQLSIPADLSAAFHRAVWSFRDWGFARFEPSVSVDQNPFLISAVCDLVMKFKDPLPNNVFDKLLAYTLDGTPKLKRRPCQRPVICDRCSVPSENDQGPKRRISTATH